MRSERTLTSGDVSEHSLRLVGNSGKSLAPGANVENARDAGQVRVSGRSPSKKSRARAPATQAPDAGLALEPHVCRHCFGRLVSAPGEDGHRRYQCTNCGASADGASPAVLCACGLTFRRHGKADQPQDAGLRCQLNPSPTPEFPSLYVAAEDKT